MPPLRKRKKEAIAHAPSFTSNTLESTPKKKKGGKQRGVATATAPPSKKQRGGVADSAGFSSGTKLQMVAPPDVSVKETTMTTSDTKASTEQKQKLKRATSASAKKRKGVSKVATAKEKGVQQQVVKAPPSWRETWKIVLELRNVRDAPVDFFGSEALPQKHLGDEIYRYQVLIALMLSSQTKDQTVAAAMGQLQKHGLDVDTIQKTAPAKLDSMIAKVGFHNNKTKFIKATTDILINEHGGDVPNDSKKLLALPGIGPKMAFIIQNVAFGGDAATGIGVDTHMHRIFNAIGWVVKASTPEKTRLQFEAWWPKEGTLWQDVNVVFVGIGQQAQQTPAVFIRNALRCSDPVKALQFASKIGVQLDYRDKAVRSAFNHSEVDVNYSSGIYNKQNVWFWLGECAHLLSGDNNGGEKFAALAEYLTRKGAKRDVVDAQGRSWTDVVPPEIVEQVPANFHSK